MKPTTKELIFSSLATVVLAVTLVYFLSELQHEKKAAGGDLLSGVLADCRAMLYMKKNTVFTGRLSPPVVDSILGKTVPPVFRSIIACSPRTASFLVAFYPEGALLYGNLAPDGISAVRKHGLRMVSNGFAPQVHAHRGNKIEYYPLKNAGFLGCYHHDGLLIAGCNKKLLEKAVDRSRNRAPGAGVVPVSLRKTLGTRVAVHLLLKAAEFDLDLFPFPHDDDAGWIQADLSWHDDELCGFGSVSCPSGLPDSLVTGAFPADTLAARLQRLLPGLSVDTRLNSENDRLYYSVCTRLPVSTVSPSNE